MKHLIVEVALIVALIVGVALIIIIVVMETMGMVNKNNNLYSLLPFITGYITNSVDSISSVNKVISGVLIITVTILFCLMNIIGYFGGLYIIKHTDLESKYPKLKPIVKYYHNTNIVLLIIEIIFVFFVLLFVIGFCIYLLYYSNEIQLLV